MKPIIPELTTFVSSSETLETSIKNGATHVILEDSKSSIRSFTDDFSKPHFEKIEDLASQAKSINPDIKLSVNCDFLMHHSHTPLLKQLISSLKKAAITTVRIQDPGLILFFEKYYPEAACHLAMEIGNHNSESLSFYAKKISRQILDNECPATDIETFTQNIPCEFEIQVQGPILIQYSYRRYMAGLASLNTDNATIKKQAEDLQYPKRIFTFYDNPHGHFMFSYFERSLLKYIPDLMKLNLSAWLIDARGESLDYLKTALSLYKKNLDLYLDDPKSYQLDPKDITILKEVATRPQKAGFFRANQTDQARQKNKPKPESAKRVGTILDVISGECCTLQCDVSLLATDTLFMFTQKGKRIDIPLEKMTDLNLNPLSQASATDLILLPAFKGIQGKAAVFLSR